MMWLVALSPRGAVTAVDATVRTSAPAMVQDTAKAKKGGAKQHAGGKPPKAERAPDDSATLARRAMKSEKLPLFASREVLPFTLIANFGRIAKDRDTLTKGSYDGTLVVADSAGGERRIPVKLRTRGHFRLLRSICRFVPLRVEFPDSGLKGTPFQGESSLKLGTHCQSDLRYEQYTMKEYFAYRMYDAITDRSFRARLAKGTYIDSASGKSLDTRTALWVENENDVARRMGGKIGELRRAVFDDLDPETLDLLSIFEYAIGNTDFSIYALHNIRLVAHPSGVVYPLPYDFDFSGLVNASYATPDSRLGIRSVRERVFRGPCRTPTEMQGRVARFTQQRDSILRELAAVPGLSAGEASDVRDYLKEFFAIARDPRQTTSAMVDACITKPGV